jgi:putative transposase
MSEGLDMVGYRRNIIPGGRYFFTVTLVDRGSRLLVERIDDLGTVFRAVRAQRPFIMDAVVVLPDHLHCIWTLPPDDGDFALRWREIKSQFSRKLPPEEERSAGRINKGERGIWQRRYWEHTLRDEQDVERHMDYIHYNPVKHGHVSRVTDWPYSSFHRYVRVGAYPPDWAGGYDGVEGDCGERS